MKYRYGINALTAMLMLFLAFTSGCYYDKVVPPIVELSDEPASYATDIQPFFDAKCIGCHGAQKPNLEAPDSYNTIIDGEYVDLASPSSSSLYTVLDGFMGAESSASQKALVLKWIEEGALDN